MVYYFPNRPLLQSIDSIKKYSGKEWIAELKKNGDRLELFIQNGKYLFMNRYKKEFKYKPTSDVLDSISDLRLPNGTQIDAELLHNKTKHIKHLIYVYDVYQWKNKRIVLPFCERRELLEQYFSLDGKHIQLAFQYANRFLRVFEKNITAKENEGLVLKNLQGRIKFSVVRSNDVAWQIKIRRPSKNYSF